MKMTLKLLPYILIQLAISFLIGLNELFSAGWSWDIFTSARFWFDYSTITIATMMSFFSWANYKIMRISSTPYYKGMEDSNKTDLSDLGNQVAIKNNAISALVQCNRRSDISDCIHELNMQEKKSRYVYDKTNKLYKLRSSNFRYIKLFSKHYDRLITKLESELEDDYINNNLENLKVKYVPITEAYIASGISVKDSNTFRQRQESKVEKMVKDNIYKWVMSLTYMLLLSSIVFEFADSVTWQSVLSIGIKILNCVFQAVMGVNYASTYVSEKVIYELDDRIAIMEYYIEWVNKKKGVANNG